MGGTLRKLGKN
jgi:hypothetical protein